MVSGIFAHMNKRSLIVLLLLSVLFTTVQGLCADKRDQPVIALKKQDAVKHDLQQFQKQHHSEPELIRLVHSTAPQPAPTLKDLWSGSFTCAAQLRVSTQLKQCRGSNSSSGSKSYLAHIYPSHNFW
jgi:hypothetical protein